MVNFSEEGHKYFSPEYPEINWTSVTTVIHKYCEEFNWTPEQSAVRKPTSTKPNKWYGLPASEIAQVWKDESLRSTDLGTWYHKTREDELYALTNKVVNKPDVLEDGTKKAINQRLHMGIYPEHLVYSFSSAICGQVDKIEVTDTHFHINDYKTSKEIKRTSYKNYEGVSKKMLGPLKHLDDCAFNHYAIQLSLYAYMIFRANPHLQVGELTIEHVKFVEEGRDVYDYPIYLKDEQGNFIVKEIDYIKVPYLQSEAQTIMNLYKQKKA